MSKNIKVISGTIAFFLLLCLNSNGMIIDNINQHKISYSFIFYHNSHSENYDKQNSQKDSSIRIPSSFRRKGLEEKNNVLFNQNQIVVAFAFYTDTVLKKYKNHLFQTAIFLPLLRAPPIVF